MPPEAYFPFVDAYVQAYPDALILVATDENAYYERIARRYGQWDTTGLGRHRDLAGRVVSAGRGYTSANVIADASINAFAKGADVLVDALLLSRCDFLIKAASAVAEFAMWVNLALHDAHIDLQWEVPCTDHHTALWFDLLSPKVLLSQIALFHVACRVSFGPQDRFHSQRLPAWAASVTQNGAQRYCAMLARGCRIDARQGSLQGGQVRSTHRDTRRCMCRGMRRFEAIVSFYELAGMLALPATSGNVESECGRDRNGHQRHSTAGPFQHQCDGSAT